MSINLNGSFIYLWVKKPCYLLRFKRSQDLAKAVQNANLTQFDIIKRLQLDYNVSRLIKLDYFNDYNV